MPSYVMMGQPQGYGYGFQDPAEQEGFNPLTLLLYVIQYRWLIGILAIVGLVAGVVLTMMQTPKYQASAYLEVMVPSARVFQDLEVVTETGDVRAFLTARQRLKSRALAQRVVYELGLSERADFLFPAPEFSFLNIVNRAFGLSADPKLDDITPEERERIAIGRVMGNLSVDLITNTSLLSIKFVDQNAAYSSEIANQIAQSYIDQRIDNSGEKSELARQFIQEQVIEVKAKLQTSEQALVDYSKKAGLTVTGNQNSLISSSLDAINASLSKAIEDRLNYDILLKQIEAGRGPSLDAVLSSEGLQRLKGDLAKSQAEYQQKLSMFKPGFPEMRQLHAQISELSRQYEDGVRIITEGIRLRHEEAVARESDLRKKLAELERDQAAYQDKNIQYTILKREVDSNRAQYESLMTKLNDVGVSSELKSQTAVIADPAVKPPRPYSPRLSINVALALALFLALAAALIYVLELLNNTFTNPDQLEKELGLPMMGILPLVERRHLSENLVDAKSGLSEAYRTLRTSLQFSGSEGAPRILMVTSSEPKEAKSTTVYKLAHEFAALGKKVLVIDADLRKPSMHRMFGMDNTVGLSNVLTNTAQTEELPRIIKRVSGHSLWVLGSGTIPPNPADLLSSAKMAMIIDKLQQRFDMVIIDAPPVAGLSDAPILGRFAQSTLLLVSSNQVSRKSARTALKRLRASGVYVVGTVMSRFTVGKFDYNYAYKYMNYYYYSYGSETPVLEGKGGEQDAASGKMDAPRRRRRDGVFSAIARFSRRLKPAS